MRNHVVMNTYQADYKPMIVRTPFLALVYPNYPDYPIRYPIPPGFLSFPVKDRLLVSVGHVPIAFTRPDAVG